MSSTQNTGLGILLMIATCTVFSIQDVISLHLTQSSNIYMVVTVRFWFFALFALTLASRATGGLTEAIKSNKPSLQIIRGTVLILEVGLMQLAFIKLGLIETHAVFVCYPLLITVLSGPMLGEKVGWRRWAAVGVGFIGVLIILNPSSGIFSPWAIIPFVSALLFALYGVLTRKVAQYDSTTTSFLYTGLVCAALITPFGLYHWQAISAQDWIFMGGLCLCAALSHWFLIKAYDVAEASAIQPFAYFQLPIVSILGVIFFAEALRWNVALGVSIVIAAGLFTLLRQRLREKQAKLG